jgi:hypothetical protein
MVALTLCGRKIWLCGPISAHKKVPDSAKSIGGKNGSSHAIIYVSDTLFAKRGDLLELLGFCHGGADVSFFHIKVKGTGGKNERSKYGW